MVGPALLAQAGRSDPFRQPEVIWGTAALGLALLVGAFAIWMVERWRKKSMTPTDALAELTDFRGMFERGEITQDEYARLREKVARRAKAAPAASPPTARAEEPPGGGDSPHSPNAPPPA
jgi:hypothetical protein